MPWGTCRSLFPSSVCPMFSPTDTIVAIATPPGRGGIGVVRVSGTGTRDVAGRVLTTKDALVPRQATFTRVAASVDIQAESEPAPGAPTSGAQPIDQVVATFFPGPASYTGEDVLEISAHGSPVVLENIVRAALAAGARLAEPGEFTLRAFLNGRIDLVQAEAVADLIDAVTPLQARAAFKSARGNADGGHRAHRRRAVRPGRAARGLDRFPGRGLSLRGARSNRCRACADRERDRPARRRRGARQDRARRP